MQTKKKMKLKKSVIFKGIAFLVILFSLFVFLMFIRLGVLPFKYLLLIFVILAVIDAILYFILASKNYRARMIGSVISLVLVIVFAIGISYQSMTLDFLHKITFLNIETQTYQIYVKNNTSFNDLKDLSNKTILYVKNRGSDKVLKEIQKTSKPYLKESDNASDIIEALLNDDVSAIVLEKAEAEVYLEMNTSFREKAKILTSINVEVQKENFNKDVKITKEPFSVFITGVDTYDGINTIARSDVNMIVTINPITHKILLTSIPRDYYVQIDGTTGLKDKLTHAGLKGVETSVRTIETLLELDINYYMKFNFTALVKIVDALGGIDVDSPFAFTADYIEDEHIYYEFKKGMNHLNGKMALAYSRERYDLREGDVARARHQQQVIKAMIDKVTSTTILTKYASILNSIEDNFTTNMNMSDITGFIQMQLNDNPSWTIENMVLTGSDSSERTNSMPKYYSSVMIPNEESVKEAIAKINSITDN